MKNIQVLKSLIACLIIASNFGGFLQRSTIGPSRPIASIVSAPNQPDCDYSTVILNTTPVPIIYWRMDEPQTTTSLTNLGTLTDTIGTYITITHPVAGLIQYDPDGAANFNGKDGYVKINNHVAINTGGPYLARTIELWFKASRLQGRQVLYEEGGYRQGLNIHLNGDQLVVLAARYDLSTLTTYYGTASTTVTADTPYQVALVFSGDGGDTPGTGAVTGYLNGVSFGTSGPVSGLGYIPYHDGGIGIGGINNEIFYPSGGVQIEEGDWYQGVIDEVALWNAALSANDILAHSKGCSPTALTLSGFYATPMLGKVQLNWETFTEIDGIGFDIYRSSSPDGQKVKLNSSLIPCEKPGWLDGAAYSFNDTDVQPGVSYFYWLEFNETTGKTIYGPQLAAELHGVFLPVILR